jgi:hypothetical protein
MSEQRASAYQIPDNYNFLPLAEKRHVTIQNLYLNHGWELDGIASLLEVERSLVEEVLIKYGHLRRQPGR